MRLCTRTRSGLSLLFIFLFLTVFGTGCTDDDTNGPDGQSDPLVVASYGGSFQDAQRVSMFEPYKAQSGKNLEERVYDGSYGMFRDSAAANKWDVADVEGNMVLLGHADGLLAPIDYDVVPTTGLLPNAVDEHGVGVMAFSYVLAYNTDSVTAGQLANPWKVLFDPDLVPGARGLHDEPRRTLEIALMADGVDPAQLYPLDLDRAFRVLSEFRDTMEDRGTPIVWWQTYGQPQTLLAGGQVVMTPGVNGRLTVARKAGSPIGLTWENGILDLDWWVVPKGSTHREEAMKFLAYAVSPEAQAALSQAIPYSPINTGALALIPDSIKVDLPTYEANLPTQIWFDTEWWVENYDAVQARWEAWRGE